MTNTTINNKRGKSGFQTKDALFATKTLVTVSPMRVRITKSNKAKSHHRTNQTSVFVIKS